MAENPGWTRAFSEILHEKRSVSASLLAGRIPFRGSPEALSLEDSSSRASCALSSSAASNKKKQRLVIQKANATPSEARLLFLSLAFTELVARQSLNEPIRKLKKGRHLLITQQITNCRHLLESVSVGNMKISEAYQITSVRGSTSVSSENTLYITNPGRGSTLSQFHSFDSVVIDGTHPRTQPHIPHLLSSPPLAQSPVTILTPFIPIQNLNNEETSVWLWPPQVIDDISKIFSNGNGSSRKQTETKPRHYWIVHEPEIEEKLLMIHDLLVQAIRVAGSNPPYQILFAWEIYHRFRELSVPLPQLERALKEDHYHKSLKEELALINEFNPSQERLKTFVDIHWHQLVKTLKELYDIFSQLQEPPKFYRAWEVIDSHFKNSNSPFRIVTPTSQEALLLSAFLTDAIDGFDQKIEEGMMEVVSQKEEALRMSHDGARKTLLLGGRTSRYRYLDLFYPEQTHVAAYDYEAEIDQSVLRTRYKEIERYNKNSYRQSLLLGIGLKPAPSEDQLPESEPSFFIHRDHGKTVKRLKTLESEPFEISWSSERVTESFDQARDGNSLFRSLGKDWGESLWVDDAMGENHRYWEEQKIDVYYSETEKMAHIPAKEAKKGDHLVLLLDDRYGSLFDRLCQAISEKRPLKESATLEKWRLAKFRLLEANNRKKRWIFDKFNNSLSVDYQALCTWFTDDKEGEGRCLGPQQAHDFSALAKMTGCYEKDREIESLFQTVEKERTNRRVMSRSLRKALTALAAGEIDQRHKNALGASKALGTEVEDLMEAVDLREITGVRRGEC